MNEQDSWSSSSSRRDREFAIDDNFHVRCSFSLVYITPSYIETFRSMSHNYSISSNSTNVLSNVDDLVDSSKISFYPPSMFYSNAEQNDMRKSHVNLIVSDRINDFFPDPSSTCNQIILDKAKSDENSSSISVPLTSLKEKPSKFERSKVSYDIHESSCFRQTIYFLIEILCLSLFIFYLAIFIFDWFYHSFRTDWLEYVISHFISNSSSSPKSNESDMTVTNNHNIQVKNSEIQH